jgi:hypothetical protein
LYHAATSPGQVDLKELVCKTQQLGSTAIARVQNICSAIFATFSVIETVSVIVWSNEGVPG